MSRESFADALLRSLDYLPDEPLKPDDLPVFPWNYFDAAAKQALRDLVAFCRAGAFVVHRPLG